MTADAPASEHRPTAPEPLRLKSAQGRWVLFATVLGSGVVGVDATAVNVATPAIGDDFNAALSSLQWTINAYTLALAGLLLLGGSLGDRYGRRRVFVIGVAWFAAASLLCAIAPNVEALIAARALQGVGGALLTPGSLAIIQASFHKDDRGAAIGAWSGLGGIAIAIGPLLGGYLVDAVSWRLIFLLNLPISALVIPVALRHVPETRDPAQARLDPLGAALAAAGLAGVTYALIEGPGAGWRDPIVLVTLIGGVAALAGFIVAERVSRHPMLPLEVFRSLQFTAANLVTFVVYAALGGALFLLAIELQEVVGFTALETGLALVPMTIVMLLLSARMGRLAQNIGPRIPMTVGPLISAAGLALMVRIDGDATYAGAVLPAVLVFAFGLSFTVAPLTATVLGAASDEHAGVASGVNNDVARVGGLLAVAVLPPLAGIAGEDYRNPAAFNDGYSIALWICVALCALGGVLAFLLIRNPIDAPDTEPEAEGEAEEQPVVRCPLDTPGTVSTAGS